VNIRRLLVLAGITLLCAGLAANVQAADTRGESVNVPAEQMLFRDIGGNVKMAPAWGDMSKGAHGTFLRLPAAFDSGMHSHSADYHGVVVSGSVANTEEGREEVALPPGSYWMQRKNANHVTKCLSDSGCVVYITQSAKFDSTPANTVGINPSGTNYVDPKATEPQGLLDTRGGFESSDAPLRSLGHILGLHLNGRTLDGVTVRLNVPIAFYDKYGSAQQMFTSNDQLTARVNLYDTYDALERIFNEEFEIVSKTFLSTEFYTPSASRPSPCQIGSALVCGVVKERLDAALARAQLTTELRLRIVERWVNFYGLFDLGKGRGFSEAETASAD
jgi:beta-alanine degradation protein BauB